METSQLLSTILRDLTEKHGCHTVILYGSHARGDASAESDIDVAGFKSEVMSSKIVKTHKTTRAARIVDGVFMDAFIYSDIEVGNVENFLRLRGGVILTEKNGFGTRLLKAITERYNRGPTPLSEDEKNVTRLWITKMINRIKRGDIEANFRRSWLQFELLDCYFTLRGIWFEGAKEGFKWLQANDPAVYALYDAALKSSSEIAPLEALAEAIIAEKKKA